ncbi:MAG: hypothetical protein AMXMBFR61_24760 [Fimbriimonadales bacterium]
MEMQTENQAHPPTTWEKLQTIDRRILYLILIIVVSIFIVYPVSLPNQPLPQSRKLFDLINDAPDGSLVFISSGWTMSSRGESLPLYQALVRLCMRKNHRIAVISLTEPAAAGFALSSLVEVAREKYHPPYIEGKNWVSLGYMPAGDAYIQSLTSNIQGALDKAEVRGQPATKSEMLKDVKSLKEFVVVVDVSASASYLLWVERVHGIVPLGLMCTGVMFPEALPYQKSGQLAGVAFGARGAYDFETMMAEDPKLSPSEDAAKMAYGLGREYMTPLTAAMILLTLAIVVGNVAMVMARKSAETRGA